MQDDEKVIKDEQVNPPPGKNKTKSDQISLNKSKNENPKAEIYDSEALYRALYDNANDAIFLMKADRFIDCNPKTLAMFRCKKEQIIGKTPYERFSPKFQPYGQTSEEKALEKIRLVLEGQPQVFEWRHLRYDGTPFDVQVSLNQVELLGNVFLHAIVRDITEQKQLQIRYETILKTALDGFWITDTEGNILEVNEAYCNMVGYSREELLSMNIADLEAKESSVETRGHIQELMRSGSFQFETSHQCKNGGLIDLEVSVNNLKMDGSRLFAFFRDITERKQAEEILRASEERYRITLDNMSEGYQIIGRDWRYLYVNNAVVKQGRRAKEELLSHTMMDMYPGIEDTAVFAVLRECMEKRTTHRMENEFSFPDGNKGWFELSIQPVPEGIVILSLDITERKKAEQELRQEHDKAQRYLDVAGVIFVALDKEGIVTLINRKGCEVLGYNDEEILGKNWFDNYLPKKIGQETKTIFEKLMTGEIESVEYFENPVLTITGEERQIAWHNTVLKDEDGKITGTISSGEDITERKKAEEELLQARKDWENIFQAIGQPSFILDPQHRVISANRAAVKKTGIPLEQLKSKKCFELLHSTEHPPKGCPMEKMLRSGCAETIEMEIEAFGGTYLVSCTPVCDNQGRLEKVIHIATDITDRKKAEEKIREHEEQLQLLASELSLAEERERRRIAAGIHDDIAQKLALAKLELQTIQNTISDRDVLTSLGNQCEIMDNIMEDARTLTFELSNPLLYEIGIEAAIESWLTEQIHKKCGIKCKFVSQGADINLDEDIRVALYQGVRELLTNVVKHAKAKKVEVHIVKDYNQISATVKDDGIGMKKLKYHPSESEKRGFGLFNIKERLEHLGGNLNIKSTPKKGTNITMTIPLKLHKTAQKKEKLS
jgi:PAS domain S-box-containing protein